MDWKALHAKYGLTDSENSQQQEGTIGVGPKMPDPKVELPQNLDGLPRGSAPNRDNGSTHQAGVMPSLRSGLIALGNFLLFFILVIFPILAFLVVSLSTNAGFGIIAALASIVVALPAGIVCALFLDIREQLVNLNQRR